MAQPDGIRRMHFQKRIATAFIGLAEKAIELEVTPASCST
jgi:hypothetical protein